ncbi:protein C3orf33 homolog [Rhinophrynus dorsalis]
MAGGDQEPTDNFISKASQLADKHINIVRNISTGLAVAGVVLFANSIKLTTKFTSAKNIPAKFIEKNVKLRGKLVSIGEQGLEVEHVPISLPFIASFQKRWYSHSTLLVRLAGVELTPSGKIWLREKLQPSQMLWFQLLNREDSMLDCFILVNKGIFSSDCLNIDILREGLGKTTHIPGLHQDSANYWKFYKRLIQAEMMAQKKGRGLWKEHNQLNMLSDRMINNIIIHPLKQLTSSIVYYWKKYRL